MPTTIFRALPNETWRRHRRGWPGPLVRRLPVWLSPAWSRQRAGLRSCGPIRDTGSCCITSSSDRLLAPMASEKATAIVLRVVEFSETSSICMLFTREFGKIHALAKGARRPKGPFESALDLLALCRVVFLRKSSDALDLLTEAKLERRFRPAEGDLVSLYAAYYVAELLGSMADDYDPHPELFDAAEATLLALREKGNAARAVLRFEMTALWVLGHLPSFDVCAECGTSLDLTRRVPFAMLDGGAMCPQCRLAKKQVVSVSGPVLELLKQFADKESDRWQTDVLDRRLYGELRGVLNKYLSHLLGQPPKMHKLLGTLAS